jgi:hypothetical protein
MKIRMGGVAALCCLVVLLGCDRSADTSTETDVPGGADDDSGVGPTEEHFDYKSSKAERPEEEEQDDEEPEEEAEEAFTGYDAYMLATAAANEKIESQMLVTPALPTSWPPTDHNVMYLAYPIAEFEGASMGEYGAVRPALKIVLNLDDRSISVEALKDSKKLGKLKLGRESAATDHVREGEDALFGVILGTKDAKRSKYLLKRYGEWFDKHGVVGTDARKHVPEFSAYTTVK